MEEQGKLCTKCGVWKPLEEFNKHKRGKYGRRAECKECKKEYQKQWRENNKEHRKEYQKQWRENNPNYQKQWHLNNSEQQKQYREANKEKKKEYDKQYRKDNVEHYKQYRKDNVEHKREYDKQRRENEKENNLQYISSIVEQINPMMKNLPVYGYIYKFENIKTRRVYIGQTIKPLDKRYGSNVIKSWIKERKKYQNQKFLDELIEEDIIATELFDVGCCKYHLDKLEACWINYYDSCNNGYNIEVGNHNTDDGLEEFIEILEQHNLEFIDGQIVKKAN